MKLDKRSREVRELILDRIREICAKNQISNYEMSCQINLASGTVYQWFNNTERLPTLLSVIEICSKFNISLSEFFAETQIDIQSNLERRLLTATKDLSPELFKSLVELTENMVNSLPQQETNEENNERKRNEECQH